MLMISTVGKKRKIKGVGRKKKKREEVYDATRLIQWAGRFHLNLMHDPRPAYVDLFVA